VPRDAPARAEAESGADALLGGEERLEDAFPRRRIHTHALVPHRDDHLIVAHVGRHRDRAVGLHGIHRVQQQIRHDLAQIALGGEHVGSRIQFGHDAHRQSPLRGELPATRLEQLDDASHLLGGIDEHARLVGRTALGEDLQASHGVGRIQGARPDALDRRAHLHVQVLASQRDVAESQGDEQRVVEVMGDPCGHLSDGGQTLRLHESGLGLLHVPVGAVQLLDQLQVVEGGSGLAGEEGEESPIGHRERVRVAAVIELQRADDLVAHDERGAEDGGDPQALDAALVTQVRLVRGVIDQDRLARDPDEIEDRLTDGELVLYRLPRVAREDLRPLIASKQDDEAVLGVEQLAQPLAEPREQAVPIVDPVHGLRDLEEPLQERSAVLGVRELGALFRQSVATTPLQLVQSLLGRRTGGRGIITTVRHTRLGRTS